MLATFRGRLAAITAVGAAWRLGYLFAARIDDPLTLNDSIYYSIQAGLNSEGHWFEDALSRLPGAEHGPLTSLYLTPWSLGASDGVPAQRFAMTVVGIVTVVLVGLLGRAVVGLGARVAPAVAERCGLVGAAIAALYPNLWLNDSIVMSEALAIMLVTAALLLGVRHHRAPGVGSGAALGAVTGLAALARSELVLLVVGFTLLSLVVSRRRGRGLLPPLAVLGAAVATLLPWTTYNVGRFNQPVLLTTNDGNTLLGANCHLTYYDDIGGWDIRCLGPLDDTGPAGWDASDRSDARRDAAADYVGDHLGRVPVVVAARVGRLFDVYGLGSMVQMDVGEDKAEWAVWAGIVCWWLLALAAIAGWVVATQRRLSARWWLLVPVAAVVVTTIVFYGAHRIRAPAEPAVIVLAAIALVVGRDRSGRSADTLVA